jgi:putative ABC transport system permease protein
MIRHYLKITWREFTKDKGYTLIKIGGLVLGIAACLLIVLYIKGELGYDNYYKNNNRIYRIVGATDLSGHWERMVHFQAPFAKALMDEMPEVELAGRINNVELFGAGSNQIRKAGVRENSYEDGFVYADQNLLKILEVSFLYGDVNQALTEANTLVITKSKAEKYFKDEDPVGELMILNNDTKNPYKVVGVIEDLPKNSHMHYDFFMALYPEIFYKGEQTNWNANNYLTYVLVKPGTDIARLEEKLDIITEKYIIPLYKQNQNPFTENWREHLNYELQPVSDIYLKSTEIYPDGLSHSDIRFIWMFGAVAVFILAIACINFINLSTARSANRAKEVGLRKTIGARKKSILNQFMIESILYGFISVITGMLVAQFILPVFNNLSGKFLEIPWYDIYFLPVMFLSGLIIGAIAGVYPSFYLSSFRPSKVLKNGPGKDKSRSLIRNGLVVFQFSTSIILIISTMVIYSQLSYILNKSLGFQKNQVLMIHGTNNLGENIGTFKNELKKDPSILSVAVSDYLPVLGTKRNGNAYRIDEELKTDNSVSGQHWIVDSDYLETLGIKLLQGRGFSEENTSDRNAAIVNQTMVKKLNLADPIGKRITNGGASWTIIGVIEDFHFESVKYPITPLVLNRGNSPQTISVRIGTAKTNEVIAAIQKVWDKFSPNQAFRYSFLDADFARMYTDIQRLGKIFLAFAIFAIIIACLGLLGLAEYLTKGRTKEIGVRKVIGAKIIDILCILNKEFLIWILLSFFISAPLSWLLMNKYLQDYAYKTKISWWMFAFAGILVLGIALLTVSLQSWRTARRNPVETLRYE